MDGYQDAANRQQTYGGIDSAGAAIGGARARGRLDANVYAYGSIGIRRKQLALALEYARLAVREAELEVERHDDQQANDLEVDSADGSRKPSVWAANRRRELELAVDEAKLKVRRVEITTERHEADAAVVARGPQADLVRDGPGEVRAVQQQ